MMVAFPLPHPSQPMGFHAWLSGSNSTTTAQYPATPTPMASTMPHIINLYAQADDQYDKEGETKPVLLIPAWFHHLLVGQPLTSSYSIMPWSFTMTGGSPTRYTALQP